MIKWSNKYECCIKCWTTEIKHKGNWKCRRCWSYDYTHKNEYNLFKRKLSKQINYTRQKVEYKLNTPVKPKPWRKINIYSKTRKEQKKEWWLRNKDRILTLQKWLQLHKKWKQVIELFINWERLFIPYMELVKPKGHHINSEKMQEYQKNIKLYNQIVKFYQNKK